MIFVAAPYWHFNKSIIEARVTEAALYCGDLIQKGNVVISPIVFGHKIIEHCSLPNDFIFWDKFSLGLLDNCKELHVLELDGWGVSRGVKAEMEHAKKLNIPIKLINIQHFEVELHKAPKYTENDLDF